MYRAHLAGNYMIFIDRGLPVVKCGCDVMCLQCRALGSPKGIEW